MTMIASIDAMAIFLRIFFNCHHSRVKLNLMHAFFLLAYKYIIIQ